MSYGREQSKKYLDKIESFLYNVYSVTVDYATVFEDCYYHESSIIEINSRQNYTSRVHSLLHEAGHVIMRAQPESEWVRKFPHMKNGSGFIRGNIKHRIDVFREEVLAWEEAEKLARYLGIELDLSVYARHRTDALKTYSDWI